MLLKKAIVTAALLALPVVALAQSRDQLIERYSTFAGSKDNSTSLVDGLRNDKEVKLTAEGKTPATFTPKTDKMGYGNVDHALALAQESLKQQGITNPTPEQLKAALNGGTITVGTKTIELEGILQMRAEGKGWGQIAQALDIKLGDLKRSDKAPDKTKTTVAAERGQKVDRPDRPQRPERPEKPERNNK